MAQGKLNALIERILAGPVNRVLARFDQDAPDGAPVGPTATLIARVVSRVEALTPLMAPGVPFVRARGMVPLLVAHQRRWRTFRAEIANLSPANAARGSTTTPYDADLTIEVNYPEQPDVSDPSDGTIYDVSALQVADAEALDLLMRGDVWQSPSPLGSGVTTVSMGATFPVGNTLRRHRWTLRLDRVWT